MTQVPSQWQNSQALQYIISKAWNYKPNNEERVELESCPFCGKGGFGHFYVVISSDNRDGLHMCHKCGVSGNLRTLKEHMHDAIPGVDSRQDWAQKKVESLPDVEACHLALTEDSDALTYLTDVRGWSKEIIQKQKIGFVPKRYFRETGSEVRAIVYPYLTQGNCVFAHYRSLPPSPKAFSSPTGWDAPLYNGEILQEGLKELIMVEGEANVITMLDKGITDVVGVPGANFKKAMWIDTLDKLQLEKIYILYDKDKVGQKAAQTLASRIGTQRCWRILLPEGSYLDEGTGKSCPIKDINEWFKHCGGSSEGFEQLKKNAVLFDVEGTQSCKDILDELEEQFNNTTELKPSYDTPWAPLNKYIGFEDGDVIDIMAPGKIGKTTFGMNLLEYETAITGEDGIIICLEMSNTRLARKWLSHVTNTDDSIPKTPEEGIQKLAALKAAIPAARLKVLATIIKEGKEIPRGNLYFCQPVIRDIDDAYKLIHDCVRRYGVKWVMFDNLQRLCDRTLKNHNHRTIHLSQISKTFADIAAEYKIKFIRIIQPHQIRPGQIISHNDTDGSSQISKDCDCLILLHRNPIGTMTQDQFEKMGYVEQEQAFDNKMLVTVALSRYSGGGQITLDFDGAMSSVREFNPAIKAKLEADKQANEAASNPNQILHEAPIKVPHTTGPDTSGDVSV